VRSYVCALLFPLGFGEKGFARCVIACGVVGVRRVGWGRGEGGGGRVLEKKTSASARR